MGGGVGVGTVGGEAAGRIDAEAGVDGFGCCDGSSGVTGWAGPTAWVPDGKGPIGGIDPVATVTGELVGDCSKNPVRHRPPLATNVGGLTEKELGVVTPPDPPPSDDLPGAVVTVVGATVVVVVFGTVVVVVGCLMVVVVVGWAGRRTGLIAAAACVVIGGRFRGGLLGPAADAGGESATATAPPLSAIVEIRRQPQEVRRP